MSKIQFPITVGSIEFEKGETYRPKPIFGGQCGDWVAVRPCDKDLAGKTYLGVLIGAICQTPMCMYNPATNALTVSACMSNPAIFVPDLKRVIFGYESWWGRIKDPEGLKQITDADINNVWYVQALKALNEPSAGSRP